MRFERHLLLEKITKSEYSEILSNHDIIVGGEFECIIDEMVKYASGERWIPLWHHAHGEWKQIQGLVKKAQQFVDSKTEIRNNLEDENKSLELDVDDMELEFNLSKDKEKKEKLAKDIQEYKHRIEKNAKIIDDIDNEVENWGDVHGGSITDFPYYVEYMDLLKEHGYGGHYEYYITYDSQPIWWPEPNHPSEMVARLGHSDSWIKAAEEVLPDLIKSSPIGKNYDINQYHGESYNEGRWSAEFDGSIAEGGGVEFVSPPMPLPEFLKVMGEMFKWISKVGGTTTACGFHIHMSIKGKDLSRDLDPVKIILFLDEDMIYNYFPSRIDSEYAEHMRKLLLSSGTVNRHNFENLLDLGHMWTDIRANHYNGVNLENINQNHVEFRYIGGKNYHNKLGEIQQLIAAYAYTLSVACNPDFKRREYIQKVTRIMNLIDMAVVYDSIYGWKHVVQKVSKIPPTVVISTDNGENITKDTRVGKEKIIRWMTKIISNLERYVSREDKKKLKLFETQIYDFDVIYQYMYFMWYKLYPEITSQFYQDTGEVFTSNSFKNRLPGPVSLYK